MRFSVPHSFPERGSPTGLSASEQQSYEGRSCIIVWIIKYDIWYLILIDISLCFSFQMVNITFLLTYCMVQSPSWEANRFAASQDIPRISRNPKVHYRTHKRPPPVSILGQPNPVHIPTSHLLEIHPNISTHLCLGLPVVSFPPVSPPRPYTPPLLTHTCHMPSPSHSSRFYHPHNIGWGVQII